MGFRINTNVAALSAHANALSNNRAIDSSLGRLNSGFRINSAADDASGMAIADSLRSQASSLGKAIMNANDAIGIVQTADKAMDEQIKILDTIKEKAIQSAQDGQTTETRKALQADISRLMEELDNIGNTTSFNGQKLLSGTFSNKEFQIGAYSNETVKASIGATTSDKIGLTRFETGHNVRASDLTSVANFTFKNVDGINDVTFEPVQLADDSGNIKAGMGLGALMEAINKASDKTGVKASVTVQSVFEQPIKAGSTTAGFSINGVMIGAIDVKEKDGNGALRSAINSVKDQTGVEASVDSKGRLVLANRDGRGIKVEDNVTASKPATDLHDLVTNTATGTIKKGVDLNLKTTWDSTAATGNILNKSNSFADVKMAHGVQDAIIYGDGATKAKAALTNKIPADALDKFKKAEQTALKDLKEEMVKALDAFNAEPAQTATTADGVKEKAAATAAANTLKDVLSKTNDIKEIADAYAKFEVAARTQTTAIGTLQGTIQTELGKYNTAIDTAAKDTINNNLAGADLSAGTGKTMVEASADLQGITGTPPAGGKAEDFSKLASAVSSFNASTSSIVGAEVDLSGLKIDKNGAINLVSDYATALTTMKGAREAGLNTLKTALAKAIDDNINANLVDGTGPAAGGATAIKAAANKLKTALSTATDLTAVSDALTAFNNDPSMADFDGTKTTGAGKLDDIQKAFADATKIYSDTLTAKAKDLQMATAGMVGEGKIAGDAAAALATDSKTASTTLADPTPATAFGGIAALATADKAFADATANLKGPDGLIKDALEGFGKLQAQTTIGGANAAIDELNGTLDKIIKNAAGKTMDTDEAQQGMYAHAMKQFLAGLKQGLNEPNAEGLSSIIGLNTENSTNFGRLSLSSTNGRDIQVEVRDANGYTTNSTVGYDKNVAEKTVSLRETNSTIDRDTADAMGFNSEEWQAGVDADNQNGYPAGVMTLKGAMAMMNIAEAAAKALQAVRSDLGSVQNQLVATVNNISVTQVNVKAAESNIRDVDFAQESATFSKHQILAQSGVYAMSQANAVQQNVMRLLQ